VTGCWLAAEVVGGFAARRLTLRDAAFARALVGGCLDPLRAPLATSLTVLAALGGTVLLLGPALWLVGVAWEAARQLLTWGVDAPAVLGAALLLAAGWLVVLAVAAITAAWRGALVTMELMRRSQ
jgi:hypothetical protein